MKPIHVLSILAVALVTGAAYAQTPPMPVPPISAPPQSVAPTPKASPTPEPTPDEDAWQEAMDVYNKVIKVKKDQAIRLSDKRARPNKVTPYDMEIVGEDADYLYLRNLPVEDPHSAGHNAWLYHENVEVQAKMREEANKNRFILDPEQVLVPPPFTDRLHFDEHSKGLPTEGRWQMNAAFADFNGDGRLDIVLPPPRLGDGRPHIFLATADGWSEWKDLRWPKVKLDYGAVAVADFDGDGNLDIAITCHFLPAYILYGNGKGDFSRSVELPRVNARVTSRALAVADFDGDGRPDVAALAEIDIGLGTAKSIGSGLLTVYLDKSSGWRAVNASGAIADLFGDGVAVGDFDGDGHPDVLVSSNHNSNRVLVFRNEGDGTAFEPVASNQYPWAGYVLAVAAGNRHGGAKDEALIGFTQFVQYLGAKYERNAIALYSFAPGGENLLAKREAVVNVDDDAFDQYTCAQIADVDGDGLPDLILGRKRGKVRIFLQTPDGSFLEEHGPELSFGDAYVNSATVMPTGTKDGAKMLVVTLSQGEKSPGGVRCFIVRHGALDRAQAGR
jgi:FG-GAP-like repeat